VSDTFYPVNADTLNLAWDKEASWSIKKMALEKFALGQGKSELLTKYPMHTILGFPLTSTEAFSDCITNFPPSALSLLDSQGRLPLHVVIASSNTLAASLWVVGSLVVREPRSAFARDPTTGLYPYETAAWVPSRFAHLRRDRLSIVYGLFRGNPEYLLRCRGLTVCDSHEATTTHAMPTPTETKM